MKGMIAFCENVTRDVKLASSIEEVKSVVKNSIILYRATRNANRETDFLMNMIVTLQVVMTENLSAQEVLNIKEALSIFRGHHQKNPGAVS